MNIKASASHRFPLYELSCHESIEHGGIMDWLHYCFECGMQLCNHSISLLVDLMPKVWRDFALKNTSQRLVRRHLFRHRCAPQIILQGQPISATSSAPDHSIFLRGKNSLMPEYRKMVTCSNPRPLFLCLNR